MSDLDSEKISLKFKMDTSQIGASLIFVNYLVYLAMNTNEGFRALKIKKTKADTDVERQKDSASDSKSEIGNESDSNFFEECVLWCACTVHRRLGSTTNFFVESLKELTEGNDISKVFIGPIILPLAGSFPEHISSVVSAHKGSSYRVRPAYYPLHKF
jgi:Ca2+/H+ antiporter